MRPKLTRVAMPSNTLDRPSPSGGEISGHEGASDGLSGLPVLAVDTGGTFTDFVLYRGGQVSTLKVPSTPADPSEAVLEGVRRLMDEDGPFLMVHGSTVGTNALLERKGARVVLVTNRGFEDVIEIGRQNRPQLYALAGHRPPPLVARADRVGIRGRLGPQGEEIEPLDPGEVEALTRREAEAWAVALLHAYADPAHEAAVAKRLRAAGHLVSVSSEILPEYREYERTSTTVVNACIAPVVSGYLGRLEKRSGARAIRIMGSNGGALPVARAREEPVHTVLSGTGGGVGGALAWSRAAGVRCHVTGHKGG
ncbi:MAG: hydantoinase/oxoprolinase family protein, partial [Gammaproteobacteria bacterium]|nr:hydantoinase/oxoprolinase family protein [Gammaproteobacteria bacterium]